MECGISQSREGSIQPAVYGGGEQGLLGGYGLEGRLGTRGKGH